MLTDHHTEQRMGAALMFLEAYYSRGDALLDRIVTGDITWTVIFEFVGKKDHGNSVLIDLLELGATINSSCAVNLTLKTIRINS
ncbi:hypothetical protein J6590_028397 [Homalodisca vitripennis]|nr:hypothetical protein J6590_028397 [Homalodisca vitripennis]